MLNKIIFGKHESGIRDKANAVELELLSYLESRDAALIELGMEYQERKKVLEGLYNQKKNNLVKKLK